jgi:hypothetical protein
MARRTLAFVVLVVACTATMGVVVALAALGHRDPVIAGAATAARPRAAVPARPYLVFRSLDRSKGAERFGVLSVTGAADPARGRRAAGLQCERVYAAATGGLCLARGGSLTGAYQALVLGANLRVRAHVALSGVPSRARVSADGHYGATTTFVSGHSYAVAGTFSTQTTLIDMRRGKRVADLESFRVTNRGRRVDAPDVNFWGVTFARQSDRFYATLAYGGHTHLIEGSVKARTARVIHDNVECPSLSPDGTRIGYKKLVGSKPAVWRFHVLDLATGRETPLAETRPIDDQLEWLDDDNLLYRSGEEIWTVRADGTGAPRRYLAKADSPAVVR